MLLSSGCEMCLDVYLHVASCSVQYSVDELYRFTLSTDSAKSQRLSKALLHTHTLGHDNRLRRGTLELLQSHSQRTTGNYFALEETADKNT